MPFTISAGTRGVGNPPDCPFRCKESPEYVDIYGFLPVLGAKKMSGKPLPPDYCLLDRRFPVVQQISGRKAVKRR